MKKEKDQEPQTDNEVQQEGALPEAEPNEQEIGTPEEPGESAAATELAEMKEKYLRLAAEFDNFRRRTAKEKIETIKTASQDLMVSLLPVLDDLERARQSMENTTDVDALKQGVDLVFNKMNNVLRQKGLSPIDAVGLEFDTEKHEAITQIPAPSEDLKGKVVDQVEKGYTLGEKVIRFAKVVIGA